MLRIAALGEEGVNLVHEDDGRLITSSHCKQSAHHLLTLPYLREKEGVRVAEPVDKTERERGGEEGGRGNTHPFGCK